MTDYSSQVFNGIVPTQESNYTAYEQLADISSALVIVSDCSSQTCVDDQLLNESVTVENVLTQESNYTANDQFEGMSSALVTVDDCSSQTCDEDQLLNESVTVEGICCKL